MESEKKIHFQTHRVGEGEETTSCIDSNEEDSKGRSFAVFFFPSEDEKKTAKGVSKGVTRIIFTRRSIFYVLFLGEGWSMGIQEQLAVASRAGTDCLRRCESVLRRRTEKKKQQQRRKKKEVRISNTPPGARTKRWEINVKQAKRQAPEMRKRKG